jgi:hypothetical protein
MFLAVKTFDTASYLQDRGIRYWTSGKNVTRGWINIRCIFCGDDSNHLGISPNRLFNCWKCGKKGGIRFLIQNLEGGISEAEANSIVLSFQELSAEEEIISCDNNENLTFPSYVSNLNDIHKIYLGDRGFDPEFIEEKYSLKGSWAIGEVGWKYRIFIPIMKAGIMVNYVARDVTGEQPSKYRNCPNKTAMVETKHCVYGIDNVKGKTIVITEGIFDAWKLGDGALSINGMEWTKRQLLEIRALEPDKIIVMFDSEDLAQKKAKQFSMELGSICKRGTSVISAKLNGFKDPAEIPKENISAVRKELGL